MPNRSKLDAVVNDVSIGSLKVTTSVRSYRGRREDVAVVHRRIDDARRARCRS